MKNGKKMFISIEVVLAIMVLALAFTMLRERNGKDLHKVSVIIQNSDDNQWAAFKYGLKMAAEDQKLEMFFVSMEGAWTAEEELNIIEKEIAYGADAIILQPLPGSDSEKVLKKLQKKLPVMLVENAAAENGENSGIPLVQPDHYAMGKALAEELLKDYNGKIAGKTFGLFSAAGESEAAEQRRSGFKDTLKDTGAEIRWTVSKASGDEEEPSLSIQPKVDFVIALDDNSLAEAGEASAANNLHGALVYGIGNSTEVVYYLDTGIAECLVVPDAFQMGYQSLTEIAENIGYPFRKMQSRSVSYTVIRQDTLFSKENQEILFTMSQ